MAFTNHKYVLPGFAAASPIGQFKPVYIASSGRILPASAITQRIDGFTFATGPSAGAEIGLVNEGVVKAVAAGTIAPGDLVGVGSTNGALITILPSAAATAMSIRYQAGIAMAPAQAGQTFSVLLNLQQIV